MKGIFCLEGFWDNDHRDSASVYPVLDLVRRYNNLPAIHHRCGTKEEFLYGIQRWRTKEFRTQYPLIYLAFHGEPGHVLVGNDVVTLDELGAMLEKKCSGCIIYFGSCSTMNLPPAKLQAFMKQTNALAIMGYAEDVDWLPSASFEILLLETVISNPFTADGVRMMKRELTPYCVGPLKKLEFTMVLKKRKAQAANT